MTFRQKSLVVLTFVFLLCGFVLLIGGSAMTPDHLPATWANWLLPGPLVMLCGMLAIGLSGVTMWQSHQPD